jgi:1-acyl-sn-glycerol-3-phosphate acyltransferase
MRILTVWPLLIMHLLLGLLIELALFWWLPRSVQRSIIARWSRILLAILGVRVHRHGPLPQEGTMVVMNHISWIDIFVLMAVAPSRFVAKAEIARWPVLGWLVRMAGTEFIDRTKRHAVRAALHSIRDQLLSGERVAVFPEGTTSDGTQLLPFHANLLQAAVEAGRNITPVALAYTEHGQPSQAAAYIDDMNLIESIALIAKARGHVATLRVLTALPVDGFTRHQLAEQARMHMQAALVACGAVNVEQGDAVQEESKEEAKE